MSTTELDSYSKPGDEDDGLIGRKKKPLTGRCVVGIVAIGIAIVVGIAIAIVRATAGGSSHVYDHIQASNIMVHLNSLYSSALTTPSPWSPACRSVLYGYNETAAYVWNQLTTKTNFKVTRQYFEVPIWEELSKPQLYFGNISFVEGVDFASLRSGGAGSWNFVAPVISVANYGCNLSDFDDLVARGPAIALIAEGDDCDYYTRAMNAQTVGALAGIVHRADNTSKTLANPRVRKLGWVMGMPVVYTPFLGSTWALAQTLKTMPQQPLRWVSNTRIVNATTFNIIAETPGGNPEKTIIIGSHLDSVPFGPGINDNGSGSCTNLELAILFSKDIPHPVNRVRFIWFSSEEDGVSGSFYYVSQMSAADKANFSVMINLDMLGAPNGVRMYNNGSAVQSWVTADVIAKNEYVSALFQNHFDHAGIPSYTDPLTTCCSDYIPFCYANLPAAGLLTGANDIVSEEQRKATGRLANAWMDTCYHASCDTPSNIDTDLLQDMAMTIALITETLALNRTLFDAM